MALDIFPVILTRVSREPPSIFLLEGVKIFAIAVKLCETLLRSLPPPLAAGSCLILLASPVSVHGREEKCVGGAPWMIWHGVISAPLAKLNVRHTGKKCEKQEEASRIFAVY